MTETSCSVTYTSPTDDLDALANSAGGRRGARA